jgi:hypothetical protein
MAVELLLFLTIDDRHRPLFATLPRQFRVRSPRLALTADVALLKHRRLRSSSWGMLEG